MKSWQKTALAGTGAGIINGLFGAGGGMVLVPLLTALTDLEDEAIFPASVAIIFPICLVSLSVGAMGGVFAWREAVPYLLGSAAGGILAGLLGKRIPTVWLHRVLGALILWGGVRYLC
ncbi:MAG TPA: sulfite exporter TauE/SafE family protein [Candidatus Faecousia intestinigallinarum]|nr:sulfite exporter TauE/SafE family protein [Candidatus Faecousia intestinigallinarum]